MRKIRFFAALLLLLFSASCCAQAADYSLKVGGEAPRAVASVRAPEGFIPAPDMAVPGDTPEYYFIPEDDHSAVRFIYYTAGSGDPDALAKAALASYTAFYDDFQAGEPEAFTVGDRTGLRFDYTCAYPDRSGEHRVYEQTSVAYITVDEGVFVACVVSLGFGAAEDYLAKEALTAQLGQALNAIAFE